MARDQDPLEDAPDPETDTPDGEVEDTAEADADGGSNGWTPKDRTEATRKITEQALEIKRLREEREAAAAEPDEDEDDGADGAGYLDQQNALLASQVFGDEAVDAAEAVWPILEAATTTADYMALFEAYHEKRLAGASPAAAATGAAGRPSRAEAIEPRVDSNRSDRSPDSDQLAEARKSGKLDDFTSAVAAQLGFGPGTR